MDLSQYTAPYQHCSIPPDKQKQVSNYIINFINNNTYIVSDNKISDVCTTSSNVMADTYSNLIYNETRTETNGYANPSINHDEINTQGVDYENIFKTWHNYDDELLGQPIVPKKLENTGKISHIKNDPWQLSLFVCYETKKGEHCGCTLICGASLLTTKWGVTAAHCVPQSHMGMRAGLTKCYSTARFVYYGRHFLNYLGQTSSDEKRVEIAAVGLHPNYGTVGER